MSEDITSPEEIRITREQVVEAFRKFPARGIANPDDLPLDDSEVISANALLQVWDNQQKAEVQRLGIPEANLEYTLSRSTIYVDAGFSDPDYLDEVANDWLAQDLQKAKDAGLTEMAQRIRAKIDEIETKREPVQSLEARLFEIATELGFRETQGLRKIRDKLTPAQLIEESSRIIIEYQNLGEREVEANEDRGPRPQIGLLVAMSAIKYGNGFIDASREDVEDAIEYARNIEDFVTVNKLMSILIKDLNKPYRER